MNHPIAISEFDRGSGKHHLYEMADGSYVRMTLAQAASLRSAAGVAPVMLSAPDLYCGQTGKVLK